MKFSAVVAASALVVAAACTKTDDGDLVVKRPSDIDVKTTQDTLHVPSVGMQKDTINTPVVGTKPETLIVNKPVVGTKKTEIKKPVIKP